jgi:hypothetical protein
MMSLLVPAARNCACCDGGLPVAAAAPLPVPPGSGC